MPTSVIHKYQPIELVVSHALQETLSYMSVFFERPTRFSFEAGDWIDLAPKSGEISGSKTYSLSSSPTEPLLRITFRKGLSELKQLLEFIQPGQKLVITQYGNDYNFQLRRGRSNMLIAGGVGIAPFRSMLKDMYDNDNHDDVVLVYLNQIDTFIFRDELDLWQSKLTNLTIHYIETKTLNRKKRDKLLLPLIASEQYNYYISGPPAMVESTEHLLIDHGVPVRNIRIDSFGGY